MRANHLSPLSLSQCEKHICLSSIRGGKPMWETHLWWYPSRENNRISILWLVLKILCAETLQNNKVILGMFAVGNRYRESLHGIQPCSLYILYASWCWCHAIDVKYGEVRKSPPTSFCEKLVYFTFLSQSTPWHVHYHSRKSLYPHHERMEQSLMRCCSSREKRCWASEGVEVSKWLKFDVITHYNASKTEPSTRHTHPEFMCDSADNLACRGYPGVDTIWRGVPLLCICVL